MSWSTPYAGYTSNIATPAFQAYGYSQGYPIYSAPLTPPPAQSLRPPQPRAAQRPASVVPVSQAPPSPASAQAASVPAATQPVVQSHPVPQVHHTPQSRNHVPPALSSALHLNNNSEQQSNPEWTPVGKPKMKAINSADVVEDTEKRQYHIGLAPGEVAPNIILVGDPARSARVADLFDAGSVTTHVVVREFVTFTGTYKGVPVSVISTGIGPPNVEIVLVELSRVVQPNTIIRVGSCGGLQEPINIGDLVISTGAVRLEDTSLRFVESGYPSVAHHEAILALQVAARRLGFTHHTGITASSSGFYGGQGRQVPGFPVNDLEMVERLAARNVYNFEMESSTLFTLASLKGWRTGTVCAAFANRPRNQFIQSHQKEDAEKRAIITGLEAMVIIDKLRVSIDGDAAPPAPLS